MTNGRFSGVTYGLSIGHALPEAAEGGAIGLVEEGDTIEIDIPNCTINVAISDDALASRWMPEARLRGNRLAARYVSVALRAYAAMTTSASKGAVRDVSQLEK